jgi:hypothetical protein
MEDHIVSTLSAFRNVIVPGPSGISADVYMLADTNDGLSASQGIGPIIRMNQSTGGFEYVGASDGFMIFDGGTNPASIGTGSANPTTTAKDRARGSIWLRQGASGGSAYLKQDNGSSTNWLRIPTTSAWSVHPTTGAISFTTDDTVSFGLPGTNRLAGIFTRITECEAFQVTDSSDPTVVAFVIVADSADASVQYNPQSGTGVLDHKFFGSGSGTGGNIYLQENGSGFYLQEAGTAPRQGRATLVAGTVTVMTTSVTATSRIFVSRATPSGSLGHLSVADANIVPGTSFQIDSSSLETSIINWWFYEPAP